MELLTNASYGLLIVLATFLLWPRSKHHQRLLIGCSSHHYYGCRGFAKLMVPTLITLFFTDMEPVLQADTKTYEALGYISILAVGFGDRISDLRTPDS
jgi:hypothetical protein